MCQKSRSASRYTGWPVLYLQACPSAFNPLPTHLFFKNKFVYGTLASSPRAVTDRLLGCVGTVHGTCTDRY